MATHFKVLLGFIFGIVVAIVVRLVFPQSQSEYLNVFVDLMTLTSSVFLRMIFMVVVPLVFSALVLGVFELCKGRGLGKIAFKSLLFTTILGSVAVGIAIFLVTMFKPGDGIHLDAKIFATNASVLSMQKNVQIVKDKQWYQFIVDLLPQNPIDSAVRAFQGEIVALMIFALIFGYALSLVVNKNEKNPLIEMLELVFATCMKIIEFAMKIAPFGIFGIVFNTVYKFGAGFLANLAVYGGIVILGLLIQQFIVYAFMLKVVAHTSPWEFFKQCRYVYLYAFSTSSSNATLPIALETSQTVLKIPPHISRFVLTIGATANQNGTALFEGVTVLFLAQVFNVPLTIPHQILVVLMSILASIGTAGVPGGSLPLIVILLTQIGVPAEGIGLILGIDRFLDMCRTTLNVSGDLVIAKLISSNTLLDNNTPVLDTARLSETTV